MDIISSKEIKKTDFKKTFRGYDSNEVDAFLETVSLRYERLLEENTKQMTDIAISVKELAMSIKQMTEEQKLQCAKIETLESRDGEMWRKVVGYIITAIVGVLIGFVFQQIGMN